MLSTAVFGTALYKRAVSVGYFMHSKWSINRAAVLTALLQCSYIHNLIDKQDTSHSNAESVTLRLTRCLCNCGSVPFETTSGQSYHTAHKEMILSTQRYKEHSLIWSQKALCAGEKKAKLISNNPTHIISSKATLIREHEWGLKGCVNFQLSAIQSF